MASTETESSERIASLLKRVADDSCRKKLTGIAIGVMVDRQEFSAFSGWADEESKTPISKATVFEIGSISKLFTSLLL